MSRYESKQFTSLDIKEENHVSNWRRAWYSGTLFGENSRVSSGKKTKGLQDYLRDIILDTHFLHIDELKTAENVFMINTIQTRFGFISHIDMRIKKVLLFSRPEMQKRWFPL